MKALSFLLPAPLATMVALASAAADFDGSKPFLCASVDVSSCVPSQDCARESAQTVNAPQFFSVDVGQKTVSEIGGGSAARSTKIERVEHQSGLLILAGTDAGQAWSATVDESSGKISYSVVGDRMVVAAFGACLNR